MSLVILLILSEDDVWCNQINQIQVKQDFKFYSDKQSGLFSLGIWLSYINISQSVRIGIRPELLQASNRKYNTWKSYNLGNS